MGKKQKQKQSKQKQIQDDYEQQVYYGRKIVPHVIERKKKRVNSLVKMKPLKKRQNYLGLPQFCPKGYTKEEFELYKQQYARIFQLNRDDLKQILKLNKQDSTPLMKVQLLHRCADGYALGRIPICPHCFGTTPVYDKNKGNYSCPGYKQGEQFISCQSKFEKQDLPRIKPWNGNFQQRQRIKIQRTQEKLRKQRQYQIYYKINKRDKLKKKKQQGQEQDKAQSQEQSEQIVLEKYQNSVKKQATAQNNQEKSDQIKLETQTVNEKQKCKENYINQQKND